MKISGLKIDSISSLFSPKTNSFVIADLSSGLKLSYANFSNGIKVLAAEDIACSHQMHEVILSSLRAFLKDNNIQSRNTILPLS